MSLKKYHTTNSLAFNFDFNCISLVGSDVLTMPNSNTTKLILRPMPMQHDIKRNQHPRQPRRFKRQQTQKTQPHIRVPSAPDVHQCRAEGGAEEGLVEERGDEQEGGGGVGEQPAEVGDACGGFLEHAGVALDEEDVEEEVEGEGAEVDEG